MNRGHSTVIGLSSAGVERAHEPWTRIRSCSSASELTCMSRLDRLYRRARFKLTVLYSLRPRQSNLTQPEPMGNFMKPRVLSVVLYNSDH